MAAPVFLITGGRRGIGEAIARYAAREGFPVLLTYLSHRSAADSVARRTSTQFEISRRGRFGAPSQRSRNRPISITKRGLAESGTNRDATCWSRDSALTISISGRSLSGASSSILSTSCAP